MRQWIDADRLLYTHAWRGLRSVFAASSPSGCTYTENNFIGVFGLILAVGLIPDVLFRHLVFGGSLGWINGAIDVLEIAAVLWVCGAFGTMAAMPHRTDGEAVTFHAGALGRATVALSSISAASAVPTDTKVRELRRRDRSAAFLAAPGARLVRLELREPVAVHKYPFVASRSARTLYVGSDRPGDLIAQLTAQQR